MAEASSARPLVEPKETAENNMDNEDALEIDRAADEERSKKTVSFGESLMPFKKPEFNPATMTGPDMMFQQMFMDPMMKDLEQHVHANTEILDRISKDMEDQRKKRIKDRQTSHIPDDSNTKFVFDHYRSLESI